MPIVIMNNNNTALQTSHTDGNYYTTLTQLHYDSHYHSNILLLFIKHAIEGDIKGYKI